VRRRAGTARVRLRWLRIVALCGALAILALLTLPTALSCVMSGPDSDDPRMARVRHERVHAITGSLSYLRAGDATGPRVIFVHGTPGDASAWLDYLAEPLPGWEAIAVDRPGFGGSEPDGVVTSLALQAAALEPLLVERRGRWPILVGHSLGGPIVVRVATDFPARVGGVLVVAGNLDPALEGLRWFNRVGALMEPVLPRPMRNSNRELTPLKAELEQLEACLELLTCPVAVMHGTDDSLVPYANVDFMRRRFVNAASLTLLPLEGADHFLPWTHELALRAALANLAGPPEGS
jgi:pimeloyl-ACP methyl ester carboxylesterase